MATGRLQEIITTMVIGQERRRLNWIHTIPAAQARTVLGVLVHSATISVSMEGDQPVVELTADCDVWCADHAGTLVVRTTASHSEPIGVRNFRTTAGECKIGATIGDTRSISAAAVDGQISISLESEVAVELIGPVRAWVEAFDIGDVQDDEVTEHVFDYRGAAAAGHGGYEIGIGYKAENDEGGSRYEEEKSGSESEEDESVSEPEEADESSSESEEADESGSGSEEEDESGSGSEDPEDGDKEQAGRSQPRLSRPEMRPVAAVATAPVLLPPRRQAAVVRINGGPFGPIIRSARPRPRVF